MMSRPLRVMIIDHEKKLPEFGFEYFRRTNIDDLRAHPDALIVWSGYYYEELYKEATAYGIPVIAIQCTNHDAYICNNGSVMNADFYIARTLMDKYHCLGAGMKEREIFIAGKWRTAKRVMKNRIIIHIEKKIVDCIHGSKKFKTCDGIVSSMHQYAKKELRKVGIV